MSWCFFLFYFEACKLKAGHDVSDGGLVTCILEMAFAGNCGVDVNLQGPGNGKF